MIIKNVFGSLKEQGLHVIKSKNKEAEFGLKQSRNGGNLTVYNATFVNFQSVKNMQNYYLNQTKFHSVRLNFR